MNLPNILKLKIKSQKLKIFFYIIFIPLFTLYSLLITSPAFAQSSQYAYTISPPIQELDAEKGKTITYTIKAISNQDSPLALQLKIFDFIVQDDKGTPILIADELQGLTPENLRKFSLVKWMTPEVKQFTLKAREIKPIQIIINVPQNAMAGGHYAAIVLETIQEGIPLTAKGEEAVSGTGTSIQLTSLLALKVKGPVKEDILLKRFETNKQIFEFGPVDITTEITNLSDTHIRPKGDIVIRNMFGKEMDRFTLDEKNIFPYTSKIYSSRWETGFEIGRFSAALNTAWGSGQVLNGFIYFWILPLKLILAALIIIVIIILILLSVKSHTRHKKLTSDSTLKAKDREINKLKEQVQKLQK